MGAVHGANAGALIKRQFSFEAFELLERLLGLRVVAPESHGLKTEDRLFLCQYTGSIRVTARKNRLL